MRLKMFSQQELCNFWSAWTETDKRQQCSLMQIITKQLSDRSRESFWRRLLNASFLNNHSKVTSDNNCRKSGLQHPVPEAYSDKNLPIWKLQQMTKLIGWWRSLSTGACDFRCTDPVMRPTLPPGAWLIWRATVASWRVWFVTSPRMSRSSSRMNYLFTWSRLTLGGRQLAFTSSRKWSNNK